MLLARLEQLANTFFAEYPRAAGDSGNFRLSRLFLRDGKFIDVDSSLWNSCALKESTRYSVRNLNKIEEVN